MQICTNIRWKWLFYSRLCCLNFGVGACGRVWRSVCAPRPRVSLCLCVALVRTNYGNPSQFDLRLSISHLCDFDFSMRLAISRSRFRWHRRTRTNRPARLRLIPFRFIPSHIARDWRRSPTYPLSAHLVGSILPSWNHERRHFLFVLMLSFALLIKPRPSRKKRSCICNKQNAR